MPNINTPPYDPRIPVTTLWPAPGSVWIPAAPRVELAQNRRPCPRPDLGQFDHIQPRLDEPGGPPRRPAPRHAGAGPDEVVTHGRGDTFSSSAPISAQCWVGRRSMMRLVWRYVAEPVPRSWSTSARAIPSLHLCHNAACSNAFLGLPLALQFGGERSPCRVIAASSASDRQGEMFWRRVSLTPGPGTVVSGQHLVRRGTDDQLGSWTPR